MKNKFMEALKWFYIVAKKHEILFFGSFCLILALMFSLSNFGANINDNFAINILKVFGIFVLFLLIVLLVTKQMTVKLGIFIIIVCGLGLRFIYILYTSIETRQQDVHSFGGVDGHAAYIEYIYNNLRLPDFNPKDRFQFYHPPLHHIISAVFLKFIDFTGATWEKAKESLQFLTLFYSGCHLIFTFRLFREIKLKGISLLVAILIIAANPTMIILSGSINNDMLSICLMQCAIYYAVIWFKTPTLSNIIKLAIFIGLGMMAKLSVVFIAPAVALLFFTKLISKNQKIKEVLYQFFVFGLISVPLGLWWGVRNFILYKLPFTYVPTLGVGSHQYIGDYNVFERLFDFSFYQFKSVCVAWGEPYFEHNIFIGLLKTSVFGEQTLSSTNAVFYKFAEAMFYINLIIVIIALISMVILLIKRATDCEYPYKVFFTVLYITFVFSYIQFCFAYPHTCTQNIRYVTPSIWIGAMAIGLTIQNIFAGKIKKLTVTESKQ